LTGVVGSDPYLAPEVYDNAKYDPQAVDVWSIAIIFCCMCLRRFPWKAPRMSDSSYKLFVSSPDPGQDKLLESMAKPHSGHTPTPAIDGPDGSSSKPRHAQSSMPSTNPNVHPSTSNSTTEQSTPPPQIKGPIRLLRLLPRDTRHIIGRMLELDPNKRATIDEIMKNDWVQNSLVCRQEEDGECYHAPNHNHHLEGSGVSTTTQKK